MFSELKKFLISYDFNILLSRVKGENLLFGAKKGWKLTNLVEFKIKIALKLQF